MQHGREHNQVCFEVTVVQFAHALASGKTSFLHLLLSVDIPGQQAAVHAKIARVESNPVV